MRNETPWQRYSNGDSANRSRIIGIEEQLREMKTDTWKNWKNFLSFCVISASTGHYVTEEKASEVKQLTGSGSEWIRTAVRGCCDYL